MACARLLEHLAHDSYRALHEQPKIKCCSRARPPCSCKILRKLAQFVPRIGCSRYTLRVERQPAVSRQSLRFSNTPFWYCFTSTYSV